MHRKGMSDQPYTTIPIQSVDNTHMYNTGLMYSSLCYVHVAERHPRVKTGDPSRTVR